MNAPATSLGAEQPTGVRAVHRRTETERPTGCFRSRSKSSADVLDLCVA